MVDLEAISNTQSNLLTGNHPLVPSVDNSGILSQILTNPSQTQINSPIVSGSNLLSEVKEQATILSNNILISPLVQKTVQPSVSTTKSKSKGDTLLTTNNLLTPVTGIASASMVSASTLSASTVSGISYTGTLDSGDLKNPTFNGRLRDDYLLTGVTVGQQIQLNLDSTDFNPYLQLVDANTGTILAFNDNRALGDLSSELTFTVQSGIDYQVRVTSATSRATGAYSLLTTAGNLSAATSIDHETITGTLQNSDPNNDLFASRFYDGYFLSNLAPNQRVQINLNSSSFDTYVQLVNANTGQLIASDDDGGGGSNSKLMFMTQAGVDYIVRATSYSANVTGSYSLTVTSSFSTAGRLDAADDAPNLSQPNYLQDDFRLTNLIGGQQVELNLNTNANNLSLQLINQDTGQIVTTSNNSGQLNFQSVNGINYIVRVIGPSANGLSDYSLKSNYGNLYDSTPIALNQSLNGQLSLGDTADFYRYNYYSAPFLCDGYFLNTLTAGQQVDIRLNSTDFDAYLELVDTNTGRVLAVNDDGGGGTNSRIVFTAQTGANYLLIAGSYASNTTGNYNIVVNAL